ncbi:hypothetical protein [Duganella levis]|uniref:Uncharacterized protein n=1 Tax=Duganella levis TaxID=2692169 RepID=A0ABW9W3E8_9BURK|nr:hypothetical protein [Duganella levis]MYN28444.1 hypothetical protein [Duganella levis]
MDTTSRTMYALSYGIFTPDDLLKKLRLDGDRLTDDPHPYDIFNFIVTAYVLAEWIEKFYRASGKAKNFSVASRNKEWTIPTISDEWILDTTCVPNVDSGIKRNIVNCLSICAYTANASKHFHWKDNGAVAAIGKEPPINDYYQHFFTSTDKDMYVDFQGQNYGLKQIRGILLQFYTGLILYFEQD